jgi:hypothetical protein
MKRLWLSLALAVALMRLVLPPAPARDEKPPTLAIVVSTPNGWWLDLNTAGSGRLGYGSGIGDSWGFKAGTLDVEKATKDLQALAGDDKGKRGSHFFFHFESERRGPDKPGPARYTQDTKVIPVLFEKAIEAGQVKTLGRGALLLEQHPPCLLKER